MAAKKSMAEGVNKGQEASAPKPNKSMQVQGRYQKPSRHSLAQLESGTQGISHFQFNTFCTLMHESA